MTREIALERLRGNIVLLTDVEPGWARHTMMIRTAILSIPGKARVALLLSAEQTEQLRKIVHETLTAVATGAAPPIEGQERGAAE